MFTTVDLVDDLLQMRHCRHQPQFYTRDDFIRLHMYLIKLVLLYNCIGTPQYGGVIIYSLSDVPLGFGIAAQPTEYCKDLEPGANVVLHQGDIGEYLRIEDGLF